MMENTDRSTCPFEFEEPLEVGMQKIVDGWLKKYLDKSPDIGDDGEDTMCTQYDEIDLDYDIHDTVIV